MKNTNGTNQNDIQRLNRSLVLTILKRSGVCSRAEIAKLTGLQQATISNIISEFIDWGIVKEVGLLSSRKGRRSIGIQMNTDQHYVIGTRLTRDFFEVGIFDLLGQNLLSRKIKNDKASGPRFVVEKMKNEIGKLLQNTTYKDIIGIGVAVPGPFFRNEGKIVAINDFPGWDQINIVAELEGAFNIPVIIDHDANAGALAEWLVTFNKDKKETVAYIAVGQGIGAGITNDGVIFRGALGTAGEIGHTCIDINGARCECGGRGCLNHYASTTAVLHAVKKKRKQYPNTMLRDSVTFDDVLAAINKRDALALDAFHETVRYLAIGVVNMISTYAPNEIIIGDEMSLVGEELIEELKKCVSDRTLPQFFENVSIRLSSFKSDPAYTGAAALAINYALEHTEIFESASNYELGSKG